MYIAIRQSNRATDLVRRRLHRREPRECSREENPEGKLRIHRATARVGGYKPTRGRRLVVRSKVAISAMLTVKPSLLEKILQMTLIGVGGASISMPYRRYERALSFDGDYRECAK